MRARNDKESAIATLHCSASYVSDRGKVRSNNEDSVCVLLPPEVAPEFQAVVLVADGAGAHQAGEVASRYAAATFRDQFTTQAYRLRVGYSPQREDYYVLVLKELLEQINEEICNQGAMRSDLAGLGTTATAALIVEDRLYLGHVGDSRAYLLRSGELRRLTADHTWVEEQVQAGLISREQADTHRKKNILTRALGIDHSVRVDRAVHQLHTDDVLLLCTDGLTNVVTDDELQAELKTARHLQSAASRLADVVNQRGGPDNITAVIARLSRHSDSAPKLTEPERREATLKLDRRQLKGTGTSTGRQVLLFVLGVAVGVFLTALAVHFRLLDSLAFFVSDFLGP